MRCGIVGGPLQAIQHGMTSFRRWKEIILEERQQGMKVTKKSSKTYARSAWCLYFFVEAHRNLEALFEKWQLAGIAAYNCTMVL